MVHAGDYSDGYAPAAPAVQHRQEAPAVDGAYAESFVEPAPEVGAAMAARAPAAEGAVVRNDDSRMARPE